MGSSLSSNIFRAAWLYRRLPAGDAMVQAGRGLSPAFLKLLGAVGTPAVSFTDLGAAFPDLDADDLEIWLAELCRMQLIEPAVEAVAEVEAAGPAAINIAVAATRVLLLHKLSSTRLAWRDLLAGLPLEINEAGSLEEADAAYNQWQPHAVILGPEGSDFNALNLLHVLKHPRAPRPVKVFLVLDEPPSGSRIKAAAARADDTVHAGDWPSLAGRIARQLNLPGAPAADRMSLTQRLLYELAPAQVPLGPAQSALEQEYPHIAAMLADQWNKDSLDALFDEMIFDSRGDRAGLSQAAMQDLLFLYRVHRELHPLGEAWHPGVQALASAGRPRRVRPAATSTLRKTARLLTLSLEPMRPGR